MNRTPEIEIIACGGCGINLLNKLIKSYCLPKEDNKNTKSEKSLTLSAVDTSKANKINDPRVTIHSISDSGSGRDRTKSVGLIQRYLDSHGELYKNKKDITILIGSFSGGSGSIILPLLSKRILLNNDDKAIVVIGICDCSSERDALNSINTLKSFQSIAKRVNAAIPLMLFSNSIKYGEFPKSNRVKVDNSFTTRTTQLLQMLERCDVEELDLADKLSYLRPQDSDGVSGLYSITVSTADIDKTEYLIGEMEIQVCTESNIHSMLVINETGDTPDLLTNVAYIGVGACKYISCMIAGIPPVLTKDLAEQAERYQHRSQLKTSMDADLGKFGKEDEETGLVL